MLPQPPIPNLAFASTVSHSSRSPILPGEGSHGRVLVSRLETGGELHRVERGFCAVKLGEERGVCVMGITQQVAKKEA